MKKSLKNTENPIFCKDNPNVVFLNYSRVFEPCYDLFYDTIHMNAKDQRVVTEDLVKRLKEVLQ